MAKIPAKAISRACKSCLHGSSPKEVPPHLRYGTGEIHRWHQNEMNHHFRMANKHLNSEWTDKQAPFSSGEGPEHGAVEEHLKSANHHAYMRDKYMS
jgi:hypothetical protein